MGEGKTVAELASLVGGEVLRGDRALLLSRVMPTDAASEDAVTFLSDPRYLPHLKDTRAGALMIAPELFAREGVEIPARVAVIGVKQPYLAFARAAQLFAGRVPRPEGVHASAVIERGAELGADVAAGPFVYVAKGARIGDGAVLYAGVHVEAGAAVGPGSVLYDHVVVRHGCRVGARCVLHPGVIVGSDGFGFVKDAADGVGVEHVKIPQVGDVEIEDDVEIGSNSCIDRGAMGSTRIGRGTKIDNLVQIGHNVVIGPGCILVAQSGIAGSSRLGAQVILAAQAGVSGHLTVGDRAVIHGQAGVMQDVPAGQAVMGCPAVPKVRFFRDVVRIGKLESLFLRVKRLEARVLGGTGESEE